MPIIRFRTTYSSPNSPGVPFKCCIDASSTEDAERKIMALFPNATNLQTFPEDGADSWDADGNKIDWSEAAQRRAKAQGVKMKTISEQGEFCPECTAFRPRVDGAIHLGRWACSDCTADRKKQEGEYNGWANYETWNVSLRLKNTESLYRAAVDLMKKHDNPEDPYELFIQWMQLEDAKTADGVAWFSSKLDLEALNEMMEDLI